MRDPIYWDDVYAIALMLRRVYPRVDPLRASDGDLRRWVIALDGFADNPAGGAPELLDDIRAEWIELS